MADEAKGNGPLIAVGAGSATVGALLSKLVEVNAQGVIDKFLGEMTLAGIAFAVIALAEAVALAVLYMAGRIVTRDQTRAAVASAVSSERVANHLAQMTQVLGRAEGSVSDLETAIIRLLDKQDEAARQRDDMERKIDTLLAGKPREGVAHGSV
jgi:septal ring factor EnvC (AmiA/AmiB activator)